MRAGPARQRHAWVRRLWCVQGEKETGLEEEEVVSDDGVYWGEKTRPSGLVKGVESGIDQAD